MGFYSNNKTNDFERSSIQYFKDIANSNPLTRYEEQTLWKQYKENNDIAARNKLVEANLKYVIKIAERYLGRGLSFEDLVAEGNIGLIKGIEHFDGNFGTKALSYAVWWIKQNILDALERRNGLVCEDLPLTIESDEDDDYVDLSMLGLEFVEKKNIKEELSDNMETIDQLLIDLDKREKKIIKDYFGIGEKKPKSLDEIGCEMGLTKERVRQIKEKALLKMRCEALNCL